MRVDPLTSAIQLGEATSSRPRVSGLRPSPTADALRTVLTSLDESKAEDIVSIDVTGKTPVSDHMVVASGRSNRHVGAIADRLITDLKEAGVGPIRVEGLPHCDWVLVDAGDVIIHIFRPEVRAFYNLEKMWQVNAIAGPPLA